MTSAETGCVTEPREVFAEAASRYRAAQGEVEAARAELTTAMIGARAAGMTLDAMAAVLGVTRQRVMQMLRET